MNWHDDIQSEDFSLFLSIQSMRYLTSKANKSFSCLAESDMIMALFSDYWVQICDEFSLDSLSLEEKIDLFLNYPLVFPLNYNNY